MPEIIEKNGNVAIDANGIPILKGYRPPFKKGEFDPRRFVTPKGPKPPLVAKAARSVLAAIRKAFKAQCLATGLAIDPAKAMIHARTARMLFEMDMALTGRAYHPSKPSKSQNTPISPITPKITPLSLPRDASCQGGLIDSTVKPVATPLKSIESTPIESQSDDDCPF